MRDRPATALFASACVMLIAGAGVVLMPARAADQPALNAPAGDSATPRLMQEAGVAWTGRKPGRGRPGPAEVEPDTVQNAWMAPVSGIGPITADPAHPFRNNAVAQDLRLPPTYRVADLATPAAKNLMPWAVDALKKQNALVLGGKNGETRQARCWETGVPDIHEAPWDLFFIQTPKEVVMILGGAGQQVRRVYLDVPHSKNPKPSWFGESVGHYENGDTLVVDTIAQTDRTFVDGYRTPHTNQLHVLEKFKITEGGNLLDVSFTADDPGTFYQPWGARKPRYRVAGHFWDEDVCASNNDDKFNLGFEPVPTAGKPDF